jgi:hypothetical protein
METRRWLLLATVAVAACGGYSAPDNVVLGAGVYTQPKPGYSFATLRTYYLDPKMEVWKDGEQQLSTDVPSAAVQTITTRMAAYKYTPSTDPLNSNVVVRLAWFNNSYSYYYGGSWCSIYYGWYGCYPSWGYAGTYSTGTVAVEMVDMISSPTNGQRPILWVAGLYAVLQTTTTNTNTFVSALNQAFDDSAYLKTNAP